ncbi:amidase signature domain-containing protein [Lasiosphaeris hirsuta]|uniref:Amidase signature domain-containing protein n=1 Tax=Lasiosphaeris hirsuta TaxID=260670 RepID=A0AA39ZSG5_9PEZI|nr:amidase signature domain-containing protein [Lasiosphaeris hirsuta]
MSVTGKSCPSATRKSLEDALDRFESEDDVFQRVFFEGGTIIAQLSDGSTECSSPDDVTDFLWSHSSELILSPSATPIPEGPYLIKGASLHQGWRLYEDELFAFVSAVVPEDGPDEFRAYSGVHPVVAVPSRLYFPKDKSKPLNGLRITVKDNFHLAGANETSAYAKDLISQGAVAPPEKSIDYFPPFNTRGDGYQGPSGSSMGAAASVSGYEWVDVSLGTDTTGSIRMPAASYGLWRVRTTPGSFSLEAVMPSVPPFDTLGILARTPAQIGRIYSAAGKSLEGQTQKPTRILYPTDFFPMQNGPQQAMQEEFLTALESSLGIEHTKINLAETWAMSGPAERVTPLKDFLRKSGYWPNFYDGFHAHDDLNEGYPKKVGKKVYTSPFMTTRWQRGIDTTKEQRDQGRQECDVVSKWLFSEHLTPDTIMLIPAGRPAANYRDMIPEPGRGAPPDTAFSPMYLATVLGVPHLIVPIGQNPFQSRVSGNIEYAPIVGSLVGARGTDLMLPSTVVGALTHARWPTTVLVGRNTFHLGDNKRNSAIHDSKESQEKTKL